MEKTYCMVDLVTGVPLNKEGEFVKNNVIPVFQSKHEIFMHCARNRIEHFEIIPSNKVSMKNRNNIEEMLNDYFGGKNGKRRIHNQISAI